MGTLGEEAMRDPGKRAEKSVQGEGRDREVFQLRYSGLARRDERNQASCRY
jgi:hypothetical protein